MSERRNKVQARKLLETAMQLMALARELENPAAPATDPDFLIEPDDTMLVEVARQIYAARRQRADFLGFSDFFGEVVWDIYLELYIAAHERRKVSVSSACIAAAVPSTTALRWLRLMEIEGIVVGERDPSDNRRVNVRLAAEAIRQMTRYFRLMVKSRPTLGMRAIPLPEGTA